jgi:hypothetical protein
VGDANAVAVTVIDGVTAGVPADVMVGVAAPVLAGEAPGVPTNVVVSVPVGVPCCNFLFFSADDIISGA